MKWQVPLYDIRPSKDEIRAVTKVTANGWYSQGKQVAAFEKEFEAYIGKGHAVAVSSGTAALYLSLLALGIRKDDGVLMPSMTFVACANVVTLLGGRPVFCDIVSPNRPVLDPEDVKRRLTPRSRFIVPMHYGGHPCDMRGIKKLCAHTGLKLIEDACHAPGVKYSGRPLGSFGETGCFSFYANKNIVSAEGGMVLCKDLEMANKISAMRSHGITAPTWQRHQGHAWTYDVEEPGMNFRMDEIRAALGRRQLKKATKNHERRKRAVAHYLKLLRDEKRIEIPFGKPRSEVANHLFTIMFWDEVTRDRCRATMQKKGVQTSLHYPPIHLMKYYSEYGERLPKTEEYARRALSLPLFPHITKKQITLVCDSLIEGLNKK